MMNRRHVLLSAARVMLFLLAAGRLQALTVIAPNGGETLVVPYGQSSAAIPVTWSGAAQPADIRIDVSIDGGENWYPVVDIPQTSATSYTFDYAAQTADGAPLRSERVLLRVTADGVERDETDGFFKVCSEFEPTGSEQRMFFLTNRGRQDPAADGIRYVPRDGGDIFEGITDGSADDYPQQPMGWDENLTRAARLYSQWMWEHDLDLAHDHTTDLDNNSTDEHSPSERGAACGYGGDAVGENIAAYTPAVPDTEWYHEMFIDDGMITGRGHRLNALSMTPNRSFQFDMGVGLYTGASANGAGRQEFLTMDFGYRWTRPSEQPGTRYVYIVGSVFDDVDSDGEYDDGEGLGGVRIQAYSGAAPIGETAFSRSAGGYQLRILESDWNPSITVKASSGGLGAREVAVNGVTVPASYIYDDNDASAPGANSDTGDDLYYDGNVWLNFRLQDAVVTQFETVEVVFPNGGEYLSGMNNVAWTASGSWESPGTVNVELWRGGVYLATLSPDRDKDNSPYASFDTAGFADGSDYRVRIVPVLRPGRFDESDAYFTLDNTVPVPAQPQSPADGAGDVSLTVTLSGAGGSDAGSGIPAVGGYHIELAEDASFSQGFRDSGPLDSPSWQPGSFSENTTYFWRIVTADRAGNESESAAFSFTTEHINNTPVISVSGSGVSGQFPTWTLTAACSTPLPVITITGTDADGALDNLTLTVTDSGAGDYSGTPFTITGSPATGNSPVMVTISGTPDAYGRSVFSINLDDGNETVIATLSVRIPTTVDGTLYFSGDLSDAALVTATLYKDGFSVGDVQPVNLSGTASSGTYSFTNVMPGTGYTVVFSAPGVVITPSQTVTFNVAGPTGAPDLTAVTQRVESKKKTSSSCAVSVYSVYTGGIYWMTIAAVMTAMAFFQLRKAE